MAAHILEQTLDLECATLQAIAPGPGEPWACYPHLPLRPSGGRQTLTLRAVAMENLHLRAELALELGGRLLSLKDRRTGIDVLPRVTTLEPIAQGPRGAWVREGAQLMADDACRANAMGDVEFEEDEGEAPATLLLHELGTRISWHAKWTLPPEGAWLDLAVRALNRTFADAPYVGGLRIWLGGGQAWLGEGAVAVYDTTRDAGFVIATPVGAFACVRWESGELLLQRRTEPSSLAPRQTDAWETRLMALSGLGELRAFSMHAALGVVGSELRALVARATPGAKVFAQLADGQTLEAAVDPTPGEVLRLDLGELSGEIVGLALRDAAKRELAHWEARRPPAALKGGDLVAAPDLGPRELFAIGRDAVLSGEPAPVALHVAGFDVGHRGAAMTLRAMAATRRQDWAEADRLLEEALLVNAEDHLTWWLKAVVRRLKDGPEAERPELLNAHYLAPMEPALRAESFLSIAEPLGKAPSALLAPLAGRPEALSEVACLLLEAGLKEQAARFLDEALRHGEVPMLRYLLAWALVTDSRMAVEAAGHVARATTAPLAPPFPWRAPEVRAVRDLAALFPADARLASLAELVSRYVV